MSVMRLGMCELLSTCWKGGGGGGSTSGTVDYPEYMKTQHANWLSAVHSYIGTSAANNPWTGETPYDPDNDIAAFLAMITAFDAEITAVPSWSSIIDTVLNKIEGTVLDETAITTVTQAHADILDDRLTTDVLPRFQAGMRDINSVVSSSFVIGQSILEAFNTREVADFDAKLRLQNYGYKIQLLSEGMKDNLQLIQFKLNFRDSVVKTGIESYRIKAVLKKEAIDDNMEIQTNYWKWPIELYQHGANMLGSIAGSAVSTAQTPRKSSALGGALSGAAAGAMLAGPIGAGIGGLLGAFAG